MMRSVASVFVVFCLLAAMVLGEGAGAIKRERAKVVFVEGRKQAERVVPEGSLGTVDPRP